MSEPDHPRRQLWLIAQQFILTLFDVFGAPEVIAARHTLVRAQWRLLAKWLRAGEALMRQLLLVEAAALPKLDVRVAMRAKRTRKRRTMEFSADAPETWRVGFRCFVSEDRRLPAGKMIKAKCRLEAGGPRFNSAWPLAERAEALLRVFNDPLPYARRLAARLFARPRRAGALMHYAPDSPPLIGAIAFTQVRVAAAESLCVFDTS